MITLREAAEAVMEQLKGGWVSESDPVAQDLKAALEPQKRKPLHEDEIVGLTCECVNNGTFNMSCAIDFARAIERAHGVGVKK